MITILYEQCQNFYGASVLSCCVTILTKENIHVFFLVVEISLHSMVRILFLRETTEYIHVFIHYE